MGCACVCTAHMLPFPTLPCVAGTTKHHIDSEPSRRLFKRPRKAATSSALPFAATVQRVGKAVTDSTASAVGAVQAAAASAAGLLATVTTKLTGGAGGTGGATASTPADNTGVFASPSRRRDRGAGGDRVAVRVGPPPSTRLATLPNGVPARDVAWHPHYMQAAVALHDGTVAFFGLSADWEPSSSGTAVCGARDSLAGAQNGPPRGRGAGVDLVADPGALPSLHAAPTPQQGASESGLASDASWPVLRHEFQHDIACLAWQPASGTTLAVACRCGWTMHARTSVSIA